MGTGRYHPLVAVGLRSACQHYNSITATLGNRFRTNVRQKVETIIERPEPFGRIGGDFRGPLINRFPYVIVFMVERSVPCIYGTRHAASDRRTWFDRTMPEVESLPEKDQTPLGTKPI